MYPPPCSPPRYTTLFPAPLTFVQRPLDLPGPVIGELLPERAQRRDAGARALHVRVVHDDVAERLGRVQDLHC